VPLGRMAPTGPPMPTQVGSPPVYCKEQPLVASGLPLLGVNILSIAGRLDTSKNPVVTGGRGLVRLR
jgi:hypothetical protein